MDKDVQLTHYVPEAAIRGWGNPNYYRMLVRLQDDGIIGLAWYKWQSCKRLPVTAPVLLVMHGITGPYKSLFQLSLCQILMCQTVNDMSTHR